MEIGKLIISVDSSAVTKAADELSRLNAEIEKLLAVHNLGGICDDGEIEALKDILERLQKVQVRVMFHG